MKSLEKSVVVFILTSLVFLINPGNYLARDYSTAIKAKIQSALNRNYNIEKFDVSVNDNGKVKILGDVSSLYDKLNIFKIVKNVDGVNEIEDLVNVNTALLPDEMISVNVKNELLDNSSILEPDRITVNVDRGLVILSGRVSLYEEKVIAETVTAWMDGVQGIDNEIEVLPPSQARSDNNLKEILSEIVVNKYPQIKDFIVLTVKNGSVIIDGAVWNSWEKENLQKDFLKVDGVRSVTENIQMSALE
jgi:osmotically-inducible protein OsmY